VRVRRGGGFDRNIVHQKSARAVINSIHANPFRRGLADRPTDWA
jgi:putative transposase